MDDVVKEIEELVKRKYLSYCSVISKKDFRKNIAMHYIDMVDEKDKARFKKKYDIK